MKFVGKYTQEFKRVLVASAISGHNLMSISAPGWGKTDMALATARSISPDGTIFIELDPASPPEIIRGAYDPAALLNGRLSRVLTGTPYDPAAQVVILDEVFRSNDVLFDSLIHATSMKQIDQLKRPVFWGTCNFVGKSERTEALRDRFALWLHLEPELDATGIARAHLSNGTGGIDPDWAKGLPTWADCVNARSQQPTPRASHLVEDVIEVLTSEANNAGFQVNPRRIVQWAEILFRVSFHLSGTNDFQSIPTDAASLLKYCYPTVEKATAQKWAQVAASIVDPLGGLIDAIKAEAYAEFKKVNGLPIAERKGHIIELGQVMANAQLSLNDKGKGDPRADEAYKEIAGWFSQAVRGEDLK